MDKTKIVADFSELKQNPRMQGIGKRVKALREAAKWSQGFLGKRAGRINTETINRIEHGQNTTLKKLYGIANALGVKFGALVPEDEREAASPEDLRAYVCADHEHRRLHRMLERILHSNATVGQHIPVAMGIVANIISHYDQVLKQETKTPPTGPTHALSWDDYLPGGETAEPAPDEKTTTNRNKDSA